MTPNDIEILIHCYCCPAEHERFDYIEKDMVRMQNQGLLYRVSDACRIFKVTDMGQAHMMQLCNLPYPRMAWLDQQGREITA